MDEAFVQDFLSDFDDSRFPDGFLADYCAIECLSHNEAGETLLVRARQTGAYYVAKCYVDKTLLSRTTESELLQTLRLGGLPAFVGEYENDTMLCVVREYVEGKPLDQYAAENELTQEQAVSLLVQLCDILAYLHGQTPPVVHRDIKPQNIIVNARGHIRLIDLGISRVYDETAREDTVCFGTRHFAAPEQYGFSQTDCRADIYSLGVLAGWLLSGKTDARAAAAQIGNVRLRRIVQRCTAFAPEQRYASAVKVKAALLAADGHRQQNVLRWACGFLACTVCLCAGFAIGRYTDLSPAFWATPSVSFEEPLVEQAVRLALGKQANDPITEAELLSVSEVYIYGDQALGSAEAFAEMGQRMTQHDSAVRNGGMRSLRDLTMLKNLRRLDIALEDVGDLAPLGELLSLEQVSLKHNPIADASPLASLPALRGLSLFDTHVSDLSALSSCPMLESLDVGKTRITSMAAFAGIESLRYLYMQQTPIRSLSGVEELTRLERISLSGVADGDLSPLLDLPQLKEAHLDAALREAAKADLKRARFDVIVP
jgi:tRNA A-37 threonylcarbamoyl transferase component Bud32